MEVIFLGSKGAAKDPRKRERAQGRGVLMDVEVTVDNVNVIIEDLIGDTNASTAPSQEGNINRDNFEKIIYPPPP